LPVTPDEVRITKLYFYIEDDLAGAAHSLQPRATISMEAEMDTANPAHQQKITLQTTISSRYYE
jgi:hypothetical protein